MWHSMFLSSAPDPFPPSRTSVSPVVDMTTAAFRPGLIRPAAVLVDAQFTLEAGCLTCFGTKESP